MKRFFVLIFALMCADAVMAQERERFGGWSIGGEPPTRDENFILSRYNNNAGDAQRDSNVRGPLAPATLLLLGLSGAAVGATIVRNTKKGGE
jgi:hypothetical protein